VCDNARTPLVAGTLIVLLIASCYLVAALIKRSAWYRRSGDPTSKEYRRRTFL
jgi:hypothetical protein